MSAAPIRGAAAHLQRVPRAVPEAQRVGLILLVEGYRQDRRRV